MTTHKWRNELKYENPRHIPIPCEAKPLMTPRQCPDNYDVCIPPPPLFFESPGIQVYMRTIAGIWHAARHDASTHDMALEIARAGVGI